MFSTPRVKRPAITDHPAVGKSIRFSFQPYNRGTAIIEEVREADPWGQYKQVSITIRVTDGFVTSRLFQHTSEKSIEGRTLNAHRVSEIDLMKAVETGSQFIYVYPV